LIISIAQKSSETRHDGKRAIWSNLDWKKRTHTHVPARSFTFIKIDLSLIVEVAPLEVRVLVATALVLDNLRCDPNCARVFSTFSQTVKRHGKHDTFVASAEAAKSFLC
jgi:hypothetical protein